ncbi:transmembrane channel-like protein 7 [Styela clava]
MSWSPSPYQDDMFADGQDFSKMTSSEQNKVIRSQLPSVQALHAGGGTTIRRKRTTKKKSTKNKVAADINENDEENTGRHSTPKVSGMGDVLFEDFSWKDVENLKELTYSMARKKQIRKQVQESSGLTVTSGWKRESSLKWKRFKENTNEVFRYCQLWRSSIHEIEGRFGNGIRSYFAFLRWLFLLNLYIFTLVFFFICVPTIIFENLDTTSTVTTTTNTTEQCAYNPYNSTEIQPFSQYIIWWFTGQGFMENTLLFYGYYENTVNALTSSTFSYNIPLAYIMITFSYFLLSLALIVKRAAVGVRESLISGENTFYAYCNKVFGGWDFCITDSRAAGLKHHSIKYELETDLEEERIRQKQAARTTKQKAILYTKRILINILVLAVLAGALAGIYFAAEYALKNTSTYDDEFFLDLLITYLVSIVITVANFLAPLLFEFLIIYEDYSPAFTIKFTLIRTVILRLVSVMFLYIVVYFQINCERYSFIDNADSRNCGYCDGMPCWETYMGQEMYKLTILDFFIVVGVTLFVEFPRRLIVDHCNCGLAKFIGHQEFAIPVNVLDIVYAQTVMWIGAFYAPLLPVIVVLKFFIFFYLKKLTLMYNCKPAQRPYRASRSGTFFFLILMFGFLVAAIPVGVSLSIITPSNYCGPFRGLATMFQSVTNAISTLPEWLASIFWFIGSAGFSIIIGIILCLILYYYAALSSAHKKMIELLREQLTLEGKDKQFLLKRVNDMQMRLSGVAPEDVQYTRKRTAHVAKDKRTSGLAYENEDARSSPSGSLPGQTYD